MHDVRLSPTATWSVEREEITPTPCELRLWADGLGVNLLKGVFAVIIGRLSSIFWHEG
jgi:hypothetical protein